MPYALISLLILGRGRGVDFNFIADLLFSILFIISLGKALIYQWREDYVRANGELIWVVIFYLALNL